LLWRIMFFFHCDAKKQLRRLLIRSMYLQSTYFYCLRIFYFILLFIFHVYLIWIWKVKLLQCNTWLILLEGNYRAHSNFGKQSELFRTNSYWSAVVMIFFIKNVAVEIYCGKNNKMCSNKFSTVNKKIS